MMSPTDKGVWIDLLCVMMMSEPYGHLSVNGVAMTDDQAARLIGTDIGTYKGSIANLAAAGIPSFTDAGMMFSRRLVRDNARFVAASEAGHKGGGNPRLKSQKPEAKSQKPEATQPIKVPYKGTPIGFDLFWAAYPNKKGKQAAIKAWERAKNKPDHKTIIAAVERQKTWPNWTKDGGQYIPNPATWLNQGRWDDQPIVAGSNRTQVMPSPPLLTPEQRRAMLAERGG
jgi:hypothetical protein